IELRSRGRNRRYHRPEAPCEAAEKPAGGAFSGARRPDAGDGGRDGPDAEGQQQRLLAGQRDLLGQLVRDRPASPRLRSLAHQVSPRPRGLQTTPMVPGPADPRRRRHRVVQARRQADDGPGLELAARPLAWSISERQGDPRPRRAGPHHPRPLLSPALQTALTSWGLIAYPGVPPLTAA